MKDFRKLAVWEKSHQLTLEIYQETKKFPGDEKYGLTSQMRRSSASIPTNIAEGSGRGSDAELKHFLHIAMGSASELEYQLLLSHELNFIETADYRRLHNQTTEVKRMLASFIKRLNADR